MGVLGRMIDRTGERRHEDEGDLRSELSVHLADLYERVCQNMPTEGQVCGEEAQQAIEHEP